ncbi:MAG: hypothetical protein NZ866_03060, partial [Patescibacteria group bacterium]|nr:hypothetical protein [Patescibacteria group bacterium]
MKLLKLSKFKKIFLVFFISLSLIFFIGLISSWSSKKIKERRMGRKITEFLSLPAEKVDYIFQAVNQEQKKLEKEMSYLLSMANLNLNQKKIEEEVNLINNVSYLLNRIEIDPNKTEMAYAQEFSSVLNRINLMNIDLNNKQSLYVNGDFLFSLAEDLAQIKPPPNYKNLHSAEVIILGSLGYALKELASTNDNEKGLIYTQIINGLINQQTKLSEILL